MSIFKRNGKWYVYVTFPDRRRFRKVVGTKKQAQQVHQKIQAQILEGKWELRKHEDVFFDELVIEYLEHAEVNKAASTFRSDRSRIEGHIQPFFGDTLLRQLTPQMVDRYKAKRLRDGASAKTINNELANLSHMLNMAVRWRYADRNVVEGVDKLRVPKNPPGFLSQEEVKRLVQAAEGSHIFPLVMTALHTGMRKSELLNLQWSDIDFDQKTVTVQSKADWHTKNYKARALQMTPVLHGVLSRHREDSDGRIEYVFTFRGVAIRQDVRRSFRGVVERAGLSGVTLHTLRHTFASQLVMAGVSLRDVQELMGHQSFDTTLRYAHLSPEHVKRQVMNLPFAQG